MAIITGKITDEGPIIDVMVQVGGEREEKLRRVLGPDCVPQPVHIRALIDTGSSVVGFHKSVFESLGLTPLTFIEVKTPSTLPDEPFVTPVYEVRVTFVSGTTPYTFPHVHAIRTLEFDPNDSGLLRGLIGRDILNQCVFNYFGPDQIFQLMLR